MKLYNSEQDKPKVQFGNVRRTDSIHDDTYKKF